MRGASAGRWDEEAAAVEEAHRRLRRLLAGDFAIYEVTDDRHLLPVRPETPEALVAARGAPARSWERLPVRIVAVAIDTAAGAVDDDAYGRIVAMMGTEPGFGDVDVSRAGGGRVSFTFRVRADDPEIASEMCVASVEELLRVSGAVHMVLERVVAETVRPAG